MSGLMVGILRYFLLTGLEIAGWPWSRRVSLWLDRLDLHMFREKGR
ncbi:MAG: hypothetical protein JRG73_03965 [Deltaproteobacteria bacterium]|nr:hypothetical protein [Deltaproteobacteria bacterium]MBW2306070.1 hypothetical protein [Deltaproteobacteria bacterium]